MCKKTLLRTKLLKKNEIASQKIKLGNCAKKQEEITLKHIFFKYINQFSMSCSYYTFVYLFYCLYLLS